jgi:hypothetical protein
VKAAQAGAEYEPRTYSDGQLELLKWIALASMFIDHFGRHLLGVADATWVFGAGRVAFPLFAMVLGLNLARPGDRAGRAARSTLRLAIWCAISVVPSVLTRGEPGVVNVFGTLGLGAALCWVIESRAAMPLRVAACIGIGIASAHVEFGLPGVFLVGTIFMWRAQQCPEAALLAILLLLATAWLNSTTGGLYGLFGTLACVPMAWMVRHMPARVPRMKLLFYFIYPIHLALIGVAKRML